MIISVAIAITIISYFNISLLQEFQKRRNAALGKIPAPAKYYFTEANENINLCR
jgi:hypothetical protein